MGDYNTVVASDEVTIEGVQTSQIGYCSTNSLTWDSQAPAIYGIEETPLECLKEQGWIEPYVM